MSLRAAAPFSCVAPLARCTVGHLGEKAGVFEMRRLPLASVGVLMFVLAACGGATEPLRVPATSSASSQTTLAPATLSSTSASVSAGSASAATTSAAASSAARQPKPGGTLVVGRTSEATNLDPRENSLSRVRATVLMYDNLVYVDEKLQLQPMLAESWETPDAKAYTFKLRKGVKFHNGREMEAADVKYSFDRIGAEDSTALQKVDVAQIASWDLPDKYTVKMTLKDTSSGFLSALANFNLHVVAKEVVEKHGDLKKVEAGTGPYMLESWTVEQQMKLKKFPDYWNKNQGYVDNIVFQVIPDEASIVAGLRSGTIHYALLEDNKNFEVLSKEKNLAIVRGQRLGRDYININNKKPPLDNVKVRQAISYAIDRKAVLQAAGAGLGTLTGPLPPVYGDWALPASELEKYYTRDVAKAKQLLAEAGHADGVKVTLYVIPTFPTMVAGSQVVAANLKEAGIDIKIEAVEYAQWIKKVGRPVWDHETTHNITPGYTDPDTYLFARFHSTGFNQNNLSDPEIDALLQEGRVTTDPPKRKEIYLKLQRMMLDKAVEIWLFSPDQINVMQSSVKGFVAHPTTLSWPLRSVWLD